MLRKHSQKFETIFAVFDAALVSASWLLAFYARFFIKIIPVTKGVPELADYVMYIPVIILVWIVVFKYTGVYVSRRVSSSLTEFFVLTKASALAMMVYATIIYLITQYQYSRAVFIYFWVIQLFLLFTERIILRIVLRYMRKRGYNLRHAVIVGAGKLGQEVAEKIMRNPHLGVKITGFLTRKDEKIGKTFCGADVIGRYDDIQQVIESRKIDMVIIALPLDATDRLEAVLRNVSDEMVDIKVVPDLYQFVTLKGGVEEFDGLPIISLQDTPYYGWNLALKRAMDVVVSSLALVLVSPAFLVFALLIKLGSRGPVFYRQERMGLDGIIFTMLKFRTMIEKAEASGPKWAEAGDPRRTAIGRILRKTSLDELPQFINALRGEMSVVGPRPERPVFIEDFRRKVPKYMLRHRMKAGITGWAQVNGLRGNTSLSNRIEYDIYYIQNWSISFDIKIMLLTVFRMMRDKNAY